VPGRCATQPAALPFRRSWRARRRRGHLREFHGAVPAEADRAEGGAGGRAGNLASVWIKVDPARQLGLNFEFLLQIFACLRARPCEEPQERQLQLGLKEEGEEEGEEEEKEKKEKGEEDQRHVLLSTTSLGCTGLLRAPNTSARSYIGTLGSACT
jgi:hypothetical protein